MSMHRLSGCPSCAEPLEEGDRFCGVCGHAVTAPPPAAATDHPTIPLPTAPPRGAAAGQEAEAEADTGTSSGGYGAPAPSGPYGATEPAPGWGSVAAAAPTLVGDPADWATPPPEPGPDGAPRRGDDAPGDAGRGHETPYESPYEPPYEARYGTAPYGTAPQAAVDEPEARHDLAGSAGTPPEGTPWSPGGESPYGTPYGTAPQDPADGPAARYDLPGGPATSPEGTAWDLADGGTAPEGGQEAAAEAPQGGAGRTCVACRAGNVDTDGYCEHCGHAQPRERDHQEEELGSVAAVSDRGLRHHRNEDSFAVAATALPDGSAATVAIVCDGVSSASRPDEASAAAAGAANEALLEALPRGAHPQEAMHEAILAAAAAVNALAPEIAGAQNAPACTLVGAVVSGGLLTIGWVGDSRAYWVPDDRAALPRRLTEDDSWAAQMVAAGLMGEAEAYADARAHAITGWLGADAYELEPHTAVFKPDHPGVVVVCTDGLWNYAESAREMAQVLPSDAAARPLHSAQVLVGHALDGGGHDNVTVAVVPFAAVPEPQAPPQPEAEADAPNQA
ncbi:protein phosphatase 2C domain-containing protein [Streptomyces sp. NPDC088762]|uniref:protein phosphatase 2C domain-containing protein n=1 Tax=Streptomyces sp. NPDC088762 TaxID=3365891 RepID=UPI0037F9B6C9